MSELVTTSWLWPVLGYLIGGIPVGVLLASARGIDLRKIGSGNIGATNAVRAMGAKWGLVVFALDVVKAYAPVVAAAHFLPAAQVSAVYITGLMTVFGHIFPVLLKFRGGKGVACAFGVFAALSPQLALAGLVLYVQGLILTRSSAVGSLTAVSAMTLTVWVSPHNLEIRTLAVALAILIWGRHRTNIRELIAESKAHKAAKARSQS